MIQVKEAAKRCVFSRRLKVPSVCDAVTLDGKLFQTRGAYIAYIKRTCIALKSSHKALGAWEVRY